MNALTSDFTDLVRAATAKPPELIELDPPPDEHWHFHAPPGFVSLAAAGLALAALGGVQATVQELRPGHQHVQQRRPRRDQHLHPRPASWSQP
jgi:hypothetical protein